MGALGSLLPLFLLGDKDNSTLSEILPLLLIGGGLGGDTGASGNSLSAVLLVLLTKDNLDVKDLLPFLLNFGNGDAEFGGQMMQLLALIDNDDDSLLKTMMLFGFLSGTAPMTNIS